jgi:hypothetical protein
MIHTRNSFQTICFKQNQKIDGSLAPRARRLAAPWGVAFPCKKCLYLEKTSNLRIKLYTPLLYTQVLEISSEKSHISNDSVRFFAIIRIFPARFLRCQNNTDPKTQTEGAQNGTVQNPENLLY